MITQGSHQKNSSKKIKAVGMLSGGLDSTLAAKIISDLNVEVFGIYFAMPWGCCDKQKAQEAAKKIGINFITLQLDERYLEIVRSPRFGRGTAMNPCVDCRIHMFLRAAQYMRHIKADFIFTGEVLGQRPMSQIRMKMDLIEKTTGLKGKLLRPLSAQLLEPTDIENQELLDRTQLLKFSGRSRRPQYALADKLDIREYNQPAGGCSLTDKGFGKKMSDTLKYGYRNFRETIALKWGRHYRVDEHFKIILGRNENENSALLQYAYKDDMAMHLAAQDGPTAIIKGENPTEKTLKIAAGLIQYYSKFRNENPLEMRYWLIKDRAYQTKIFTHNLSVKEIEKIHI